jgi:cytochrome b561
MSVALSPGFVDRRLPSNANLRQSFNQRARVIQGHAPATKLLHWGTLAVILVAVCAIYLREATEDKGLRQVFMELHRQMGMLVLMGLGFRIAVRLKHGLADHAGKMHFLFRWAALGMQLALYAMLLALPLMGWAASSAHDIKLSLFGVISLPDLVRPDSDVAETLDDLHKWLAWAMGAMVLIHAGAALWHHFFRKDNVLVAMLPGEHLG